MYVAGVDWMCMEFMDDWLCVCFIVRLALTACTGVCVRVCVCANMW